jgi:hypothetical protein
MILQSDDGVKVHGFSRRHISNFAFYKKKTTKENFTFNIPYQWADFSTSPFPF